MAMLTLGVLLKLLVRLTILAWTMRSLVSAMLAWLAMLRVRSMLVTVVSSHVTMLRLLPLLVGKLIRLPMQIRQPLAVLLKVQRLDICSRLGFSPEIGGNGQAFEPNYAAALLVTR